MNEKIQNTYSSSTKRIAKNTLMLYFRQILIMLVSLYTVRVVLATLGAEDYGIYNVVAGVVVLFSFVNNAMATATQRFLNYNLGKENIEKTQETFSASVLIHFSIAIIFIVLAESLGLWFVNSKLNIPTGRRVAAMWCYQFSIITTVFNILRVPYNAVIIAYEKMSFFAFISIIESVLKLLVVYLLLISSYDKLIVYVILLTFVSIVILFCYRFYCNRNFKIAHYKKITDISLVKEILSFSGWSLFGATANVANQQGINIVLNMFTNVTVNAAMGIANQVNSAVYSFVSNFQTAFNPQLVKSYVAENKENFKDLVVKTSKISFMLLWFFVLPLNLNLDAILHVWLENVPAYSVSFVRLILILSLLDAISGPLWMAVQATGKIKKYQIIISCLIFANLPLSIVAFILGANPCWVLYIKIILSFFITVFRLIYLKVTQFFSVYKYVKSVLLAIVGIVILSYVISQFCSSFFGGLAYFFVSCVISAMANIFLFFFIGISNGEREFIRSYLTHRVRK